MKLEWNEAPNHISYGAGMMETVIPLGKDYSLSLYCTADQIGEAEKLFKQPWQGLTDEDIEEGIRQSWVTEQAFQSVAWWADAKLKEKNT
jgi:hypothetical protein